MRRRAAVLLLESQQLSDEREKAERKERADSLVKAAMVWELMRHVAFRTCVGFYRWEKDASETPEEFLRIVSEVVAAGELHHLADSLKVPEEFNTADPPDAVEMLESIYEMIDADPLFDGIEGGWDD
jgi:hypothetical protein